MTRLIAVRHGPVEEEGICYGRLDVATRIPQAALEQLLFELRNRLSKRKIRLWTSPAVRCRRVATHLERAFQLSAQVEDRLHELAFGTWEGRSWSELDGTPEMIHWMNNWKTARPPGGESLEDLRTRVQTWYRELDDNFDVELVVTHAGVIRELFASLEKIGWDEALARRVEYLRPFVIPGTIA